MKEISDIQERSFIQELTAYHKKALALLKEFSHEKITESATISDVNRLAVERLASFCQKGKMLRGFLILIGYQCTTGEQGDNVLPFSVAYELIGSACLIHDDIIDQSNLRRGRPSIHQNYSQEMGEHQGKAFGILIGDLAHSMALDLATTSSNIDARNILRALNLVARIIQNTTHGELLDVVNKDISNLQEDNIILIQKYKTAYYTIAGPLQIGAILGNSTQNILESMQRYGIPIGIAFQIKDDMLGVFGNEQQIGKSPLTDAKEGKPTLIVHYALAAADKKSREELVKNYGNPNIGEAELDCIRDIFVRTGALAKTQAKAQEFVATAKQAIPGITNNKTLQSYLTELANFAIERVY